MIQKNKKLLLAHCTFTNRKLQKDLSKFLTLHNICVVELMQKLNISVSLPLKLSGTLNDLIVTDNCNYSFKLHLFRNIIILEQTNEQYDITYVSNITDFSTEFIEKFWIDGTTFFSIDLSNSIITCKGYFGESLSIFLDECVDLNKFLAQLEELCTDFLNDSFNFGDFDVNKIKNTLKLLLGCNTFYVAIEYSEGSA